MKAFQTVLLPTTKPEQIKRLNSSDSDLNAFGTLDVKAEIDRALAVAPPCVDSERHEIHFVGEPLVVPGAGGRSVSGAREWSSGGWGVSEVFGETAQYRVQGAGP